MSSYGSTQERLDGRRSIQSGDNERTDLDADGNTSTSSTTQTTTSTEISARRRGARN